MKTLNSAICSWVLLISFLCTTLQLSLPEPTEAPPQQPVNLDSSMEALFNFTYQSRLLYRLRSQINAYDDSNPHVSRSCRTVLQVMLNSPAKHRWSLSMLDANAPLPSSLLWDQFSSVGGYAQCLNIKDVHNEISIRGQYCLLDLRVDQRLQVQTGQNREMENFVSRVQYINRRFPLILGMCIPSTCSSEEISYLMKEYLNSRFPVPVLQTKVEHCQSSKDFLGPDKSFFELLKENNIIIAVSIISTAIALVFVGTIVDSFSTDLKESTSKLNLSSILACFSITRSTTILLGLKSQSRQESPVSPMKDTNQIEKRFAYLHGIRTLFILWIIVAHSSSLMPASIVMPVAFLSRHPHDMVQMAKDNGILGIFFNNGTLAVEGFFLISGLLLVAMMISKNLQNKVNFAQFVFLRWIRFAPTFLGMIAIQKTTILFGNGPFFSKSLLNASILKSCQDNQWWKSFLFINNWFDLSNTCIPVSWFISVDMQIHVIGFGLIVLLRNRLTRMLLVYCIVMILFSVGLPTLLMVNGLTTFSTMDLFTRYEKYSVRSYILLYTATYIHMGPYFFGAIIGFILVRCKQVFPSQFIQTLTWWICLSFAVFGPFINVPESDDVGHLMKGLMIGSLHAVWLVCLGIVFYILSQAEVNEHVLPVKRFLSSSLCRPLSRLSFSMYLSHMTPIWFNVYTVKAPFEVNTTSITLFVFGILGQTIALSYMIFVLFECPSVNLMKVFFSIDKLAKNVHQGQLESIAGEEEKLKMKAMLQLQLMQNKNNEHVLSLQDTCVSMNVPKIIIQGSEEENNNQTDSDNLNSSGL